MSILFAYMAGGEEGGVRGFKMFCQMGSVFFYLLRVCVGRGVRFRISPSVKKINKCLVSITKSPTGLYFAYLFLRYFFWYMYIYFVIAICTFVQRLCHR